METILGRKKVFISGLIIFGFSSLWGGLALNSIMLITARLIQGLGAAIFVPATLAIIMDNFHGNARQHAIIIYGAMSGIGISLGLVLGAEIATLLSWRDGFLINVPITIILSILTYLYVPNHFVKGVKLDYLGARLSFLSIILIINGIGPKIISLSLGSGMLILFIFYENRNNHPLLPFAIFKSYRRLAAYLIRFIFFGCH